MGILIRKYQIGDQKAIKELNYKWLLKYNLYEPIDDLYLDHPETSILDKNGIILVAESEDIIGSVSMLPVSLDTAEIMKFCVDENHQRKGIGTALFLNIIQHIKELGYKRVILYSNHHLVDALNLYKKMGFKDLVGENKYDTSDIKMYLEL